MLDLNVLQDDQNLLNGVGGCDTWTCYLACGGGCGLTCGISVGVGLFPAMAGGEIAASVIATLLGS